MSSTKFNPKEIGKRLKKVMEKILTPKNRVIPQLVLQPYRNKQRPWDVRK